MLLRRATDTFDVPDRLPVLPLRDVVLFPYVTMPLLVGRTASLGAVEQAWRGDRFLVLTAQKSGDVNDPLSTDLFRTGVVARIQQASRLPNGTVKVLVEAIARVRLTRITTHHGVLRASLAALPWSSEPLEAGARVRARQVLERFEEYVTLQRRIPQEVLQMAMAGDDDERSACVLAAHLAVRHEIRQRLLESPTLEELYEGLYDVISGELEILRLERKIDDEVRGSIFRNQREFYLQEQLRAIHRELGEDEGDDADELEGLVEAKGLPEAVKARALREVKKLKRMAAISPEATVGRNYLDWLLGLPWTEQSEDVLDVAHARQVLDEDHFGLADVKDRVLDYLAVLGLVGKLEGPILCLVGPPGVGKTSMGRSIARAMGRKFVRMSLGGVRDEAEIRGHRRTYIGSQPGRIIQAMRRAETVNPVLLLDEIDKLGQDYRGDPAAALLEVLDPEQNRAFNDHYLEVDYDLSRVLFITTANSLATIPEPLRDRMELLRLPGYLDHEKHAIARQFLFPRQLERHGIAPASVEVPPAVIAEIVRLYTREAGVRELERRIAKVARKLARRRVEGGAVAPAGDAVVSQGAQGAEAAPAAQGAQGAGAAPDAQESVVREVLTSADVRAFLGVAPYDPEDLSREDKVGVATGLAYTTVGGEVLEIEVAVLPGRGRVHLTGALGDVMKESAGAALSYTRANADALGIDRDFHKTRDIHVHIPAGATPKDGPSAGIAICTALVSALSGIAVKGHVAMTGEITLRGRVLPIGGLKEKSVAALRAQRSDVLIPHLNARELEELPEDVRAGIAFHPVETMDEVLRLALVREPRPLRESAREAAREGAPSGATGFESPAATTRRPGKGGRRERGHGVPAAPVVPAVPAVAPSPPVAAPPSTGGEVAH
ncbi:MAG: endopeptidase La [Gemmatimonadaceae bacterium]